MTREYQVIVGRRRVTVEAEHAAKAACAAVERLSSPGRRGRSRRGPRLVQIDNRRFEVYRYKDGFYAMELTL